MTSHLPDHIYTVPNIFELFGPVKFLWGFHTLTHGTFVYLIIDLYSHTGHIYDISSLLLSLVKNSRSFKENSLPAIRPIMNDIREGHIHNTETNLNRAELRQYSRLGSPRDPLCMRGNPRFAGRDTYLGSDGRGKPST